jgi:hypothetical protein
MWAQNKHNPAYRSEKDLIAEHSISKEPIKMLEANRSWVVKISVTIVSRGRERFLIRASVGDGGPLRDSSGMLCAECRGEVEVDVEEKGESGPRSDVGVVMWRRGRDTERRDLGARNGVVVCETPCA